MENEQIYERPKRQNSYEVNVNQEADTLQESNIEINMNKILTRLHQNNSWDTDLRADTVATLEGARGLIYKYSKDVIEDTKMLDWVIPRIKDPNSTIEYVLELFNDARKSFLPWALKYGFSLKFKPKYPWITKFEDAQQITLNEKAKADITKIKKK